jgi:hypothetical protein
MSISLNKKCQSSSCVLLCKYSIYWVFTDKKICHHFEFNYILNLYVLSMCFVRYRNWIVCTICNAAPTLFFRHGKIWGEFWHSSCAPGTYAAVPWSLRISLNLTDSKQLVCHQKSAAVIKVISVDWAGVILVWLCLVNFPIFTQTSMLSHHRQLGVAFAFPPPLFLVLLHAYEPNGMQFDVWWAG